MVVIDRDHAFRGAIAYRKLLSHFDEKENEKIWYAAAGASNNLHYGKLDPFAGDLPQILSQLLRYDVIGTPFYPGEIVDRFLKLSGRFFPEYYAGINMQVYTPAEVCRKIRDLRKMTVLLIPKDHKAYPIMVDEANSQTLSRVLVFPSRLLPARRRAPYLPGLEIMKYITENFTVAGEFHDFEIWRRNSR